MTIVSSLRRARKNAQLTLSEVAAPSGVGETNLSAIENARRDPSTATVQRIADTLGVTFVAVPVRGRSSAALAAAAITDAQTSGNPRLAYRNFIQFADDLAAVDPVTRVVLVAEEPERSGERWDDALAALVEYRLTQAAAPLPQWVRERTGDRKHTWEPQRSSVPLPVGADENLVPEPFRRRGVLIEESELVSA